MSEEERQDGPKRLKGVVSKRTDPVTGVVTTIVDFGAFDEPGRWVATERDGEWWMELRP